MATPKPKPMPSVQSLIKKKALHATPPSDQDIQALLISLLYSLPDDTDHHAKRAEVKLKILMGLHQINQDNKEESPTTTTEVDKKLLALLAERQAKKQ